MLGVRQIINIHPVKIMVTLQSSLSVLIVTAYALATYPEATQALPQTSAVIPNPVLNTATVDNGNRPQVIQVAVMGNNYNNAQATGESEGKIESESLNQRKRGHDLKPSQRMLTNAFAFGMFPDIDDPELEKKRKLKPLSLDDENLKDENDEFNHHFYDKLGVWNDRLDGENSQSKEDRLTSGGAWHEILLRDSLSADPSRGNSKAKVPYVNRFHTNKSKKLNKVGSHRLNRKPLL